MKKIGSLILALMFMLCTSALALAEMEAEVPAAQGSEEMTFTFTKAYRTSDGEEPAAYPNEKLEFRVQPDGGNPDGTTISIAEYSVAGNTSQILVTVPSYTKVGKWNYTVTEVEGKTQGVTYAKGEFRVQVFVSYGSDDGELLAQTSFTTSDGNGGKVEGIVNTYDLGNLTIEKEVTGNLADKEQAFAIDVTFTSDKPVLSAIGGAAEIQSSDWTSAEGGYSYTAAISLKSGESAAFLNIPAGVRYIVTEQEQHVQEDASGSDGSKGYTVAYDGDGARANSSGTITANDTAVAHILNTKEAQIDTGIPFDSSPYAMLLGIAILLGMAILAGRRTTGE